MAYGKSGCPCGKKACDCEKGGNAKRKVKVKGMKKKYKAATSGGTAAEKVGKKLSAGKKVASRSKASTKAKMPTTRARAPRRSKR